MYILVINIINLKLSGSLSFDKVFQILVQNLILSVIHVGNVQVDLCMQLHFIVFLFIVFLLIMYGHKSIN